MTPRRMAGYAAVLGLLVPAVCETAYLLHPSIDGDWMLPVWPTSFQLVVLDHGPNSWGTIAFVFGVSIGLNVVLYAAIGWLAGLVWQ